MRIVEILLFSLIVCSACVSVPDVDELLNQKHDTQDSLSEALEQADQLAAEELQTAEDAPLDVDRQIAASRALARAADLRLVAFQVRRIEAQELTVDELVALDENVDKDVRTAILGLCRIGLERGRAAVKLAPESVPATCYMALHLSLVAWSESRAAAVLNGRGPALQKLTKVMVRDFPGALDAGPLRVRGRFLDRAPWPYADREQARVLLEEAVRLAPNALNWMFLGDVYWSLGDRLGASQAWRSGANDSSLSPENSPWRRALNQARLDAIERAGN